jgi:acetoin utilization deacetylase AcuC-like enzyme
MVTAYAFVDSPEHVFPDHPEAPARLERVQIHPRAQKLDRLQASWDEIGRVHAPAVIHRLEQACASGPGLIDYAPTYVTPSSFDSALAAAGGAIACARAVIGGEADNAFAIVRPPGHHADPDRPMGFCLFNNIAIAARDAIARGLERVIVIDYDAHHGNGTQAAFVGDARLGFLSTHQENIYPGTGFLQDAPQAKKRIANFPLPAYAGDHCFEAIAEKAVAPLIESFRPQLILVSAGFDSHWNDPITSLGLSSAGFYALSKKLVDLAGEHCNGRIVFVLEGGYAPINVANGVDAVFAALTGDAWVDPHDSFPRKEPDISARLDAFRAWHGL